MSGEHLFSQRVFASEFLATDGIRNIKPGKRIPRRSLKANVLCTTHNSKLSDLDSEAGTLSDALREHFQSTSPREARAEVDGWEIERWCLKLLYGASASRWAINDQAYPPDPALVKIVFGEGRLGLSAGLYVVKKPEPMRPLQKDRMGCMVFPDVNDERAVMAAHIQLQGIRCRGIRRRRCAHGSLRLAGWIGGTRNWRIDRHLSRWRTVTRRGRQMSWPA